VSLSFQWLGTASLIVKDGNQVLVIDPFFTRPSLLSLLHPLVSDPTLVAEYLPECDYILLTHAHYDHLLDVAEVMRQTGAIAYGSDNACQLMVGSGAPIYFVQKISVGDHLSLGSFQVEVVYGQHSVIPFSRLFNGPLRLTVRPPRYAWDYRMDVCLGFCITVQGYRLLVCAASPQPADLWFPVAQERDIYYRAMLPAVEPQAVIPIHWDNFTRSLSKPLHPFTRPGRLSLSQFETLVHQTLPGCRVLIPEFSRTYEITELCG
jgi:hypothetical protein